MKKKLFVLFLGTVTLILFLELFLFFISQLKSIDKKYSSNGKPVILFVGNSYTAGVAVGSNEKFTNLIQDKLPDFNVQNVAAVNVGTGFVRDHMKEWGRLNPKIVFLMIGQPNIWNNQGFRRYLKEKNGYESGLNLTTWLIKRSRIYKLINYLNYQLNLTDRIYGRIGGESDEELRCHITLRNFSNILNFNMDFTINSVADKSFQQEEENKNLSFCIEKIISQNPLVFTPRYIRVFQSIKRGKPLDALLPDLLYLTQNGTRYNYFTYEVLSRLYQKNEMYFTSRLLKLKNDIEAIIKRKKLKAQIEILNNPVAYFSHLNGLKNKKSIIQELFKNNVDYGYDIEFYKFGSYMLRSLDDFDGACKVLLAGLENYPIEYMGVNLVTELSEMSKKCSPEVKIASDKKIEDLVNKKFINRKELSFYQNDEELQSWRFHDINIIADFFKSRGAVVIMQNYLPKRHNNYQRDENLIIDRIAREKGYHLIDHFQYFLKKYPDTKKRDFIYLQNEYKGTSDDHFSPEGHRQVAEQIYNYLVEKNILKF